MLQLSMAHLAAMDQVQEDGEIPFEELRYDRYAMRDKFGCYAA
jgi:hypothetical protein